MSVLFFLLTAAMVLLALAVLVPVLSSGKNAPGIDRDQQNIAIARERLAELEALAKEGVITADELKVTRAEVESTLLDDVAAEQGRTADLAASLPGQRWVGAAVAAGVPLLAGTMYLTLGTPGAILGAGGNSAALPKGHPQAQQQKQRSVEELVAQVEQRLQLNPNDAKGWEVLANTYMAMKRYSDAAKALQRQLELVGEQAELLVRRADALAMSQDGVLEGEPQRLLDRALQLDPSHPTGLWLSAIAADRRGETEKSLALLRKAEPLFADKPESYAALKQQIIEAERQLGIAPKQADAGATGSGRETKQAGPVSITVQVSLDDKLGQQAAPDDTVFIIARAADGPRMPLAVARKSVKDLPLEVRLDDTMAMMPAMKLSNFGSVEVVARVSKSGDAIAASGDFIGKKGPLNLPLTEPVVIAISERVP